MPEILTVWYGQRETKVCNYLTSIVPRVGEIISLDHKYFNNSKIPGIMRDLVVRKVRHVITEDGTSVVTHIIVYDIT